MRKYPPIMLGDLYTWGDWCIAYEATSLGRGRVTGFLAGDIGGEYSPDEDDTYELRFDEDGGNFAWVDPGTMTVTHRWTDGKKVKVDWDMEDELA